MGPSMQMTAAKSAVNVSCFVFWFIFLSFQVGLRNILAYCIRCYMNCQPHQTFGLRSYFEIDEVIAGMYNKRNTDFSAYCTAEN